MYSTPMGAPGEDVRLSPLARSFLPLSLECKCVERLNVWSCLEQAATNAPNGTTPCLVFSKNRSPTYAVVPWELLLGLYGSVGSSSSFAPSAKALRLLEDLKAELTGEGGGME